MTAADTLGFDMEKDYFAVLDANRELQMEVFKLKQLLVKSQKRVQELEEKMNENDTTAAPKSSSKNEATEKEIFTRRQEPAVQKNRIVIHDLDDEESEAEIQIHPDTEPSVKNKSSEKDSAPAAPSPLDEHGELIEWTKMIRMRYPGSWSTMSSRHKQRTFELVKEFTEIQLKDLAKECFVSRGSKEILCLPEGLADDFVVWFDEKLDEGALNVLGSPKKVAKKIPHISTGVSKKNAPKEVESSKALSPQKEKSPLKSKNNSGISVSPQKEKSPLKSKNNSAPNESFEAFLLKKGITSTITVAEVDVDQLVISEPALKVVNILTANYAQTFVDQVRFRELVEKLGEENYTDAQICEAFEKEFIPEALKRKSSIGNGEGNVSKKAKIDCTAVEEMTRYNHLIRSLVPDFNKSDEGIRIQVKKKVKTWLKAEMGSDFESCIASTATGGKKEHKTYMIPKKLETIFLSWIKDILHSAGLLK